MDHNDHNDNMTRLLAFSLLLIAVALTFLPFLGCTPFYTKGEPREAVVALSMLKTGNWILPLSNGDVIPYKPPFLAWCIALVSLIPGAVTEYTSRLPSALALIIMVMVGYRFWARRVGAGTSMVGAVITFTFFEVYRAGMACRVDMLLTMFIVLAFYALYRWAIERDMKGIPWGAVLLMSGGVLTKGPVGMILPCLVCWLTVLLCGHRLWRCTWKLFFTALFSLVLPALWYAAAWERGGSEFLDLVVEENFGRMTGTMSYESHVNPWWYNLLTLVGGMAPYTLLLLMGLLSFLAPTVRHSLKGALYRWRTVDAARFFLVVAPLTVLVFYCFPSSKRSVYLLPMYPFLAMQMALFALWLSKRFGVAIKAYTVTICVVAMAAFVLFVCFHHSDLTGRFTPGLSLKAMMAIKGFMEPAATWKYILAGGSAAVAAVVFVRQFRDSGTANVIGMCAVMTTLYWAFGGVYQPAAVSPRSDIRMAREIERIKPQGTIYSFIGEKSMRFFTADFYLGDRIEPFDLDTAPTKGMVMAGEGDGDWFREQMKGRLVMTPVKTWGKRSCDINLPVTLWRYERIDEVAPRNDADTINSKQTIITDTKEIQSL